MNAIVPSDSHKKLTTEVLARAVDVLDETMQLDPWELVLDKERQPIKDPATGKALVTFNGRVNSQRLKAATAVLSIVERLGDQALRRQAGNDLRKLLQAIKTQRPELLGQKAKTISVEPSPPATP